MKLKVVIHPAEEGGFWAEVSALRGCCTQGESVPEVLERIKEAVLCHLEASAAPA
ncbi:MAG TPA: type II toxin-antitoxin system HicB family antitoxin [Gemmataceae bacterium]|nr:type II toxin-antitoxin system HicB family antitoxin [Gemmataceae bacterium]